MKITDIPVLENENGYPEVDHPIVSGPSISIVDSSEEERENYLGQLANQIPGFYFDGKPDRLSGGLLNYVWRLTGSHDSRPESLIAKWAPPFIASSPENPLDPDRILIETKAMAAFSPGGVLSFLASDQIRLPQLIHLDPKHRILFMEDVCQCPDLEHWIRQPHPQADSMLIGDRLGSFIGQLHKHTARHPELALEFANHQIQQTRLDVLYKNVIHYARRAHLPAEDEMGRIAAAYGELLQQPGKSLIMGDLWLPSVIISGMNLRIIDWELAHYGRPSQDVGHLVAHLWMHIHRSQTASAAGNAQAILHSFLKAYRETLGDDFSNVFGLAGVKESGIHFGSEVLARTVGIFQDGYLYQGLHWDDPIIQEAVQFAARHILSPLELSTFDDLDWCNDKRTEINEN